MKGLNAKKKYRFRVLAENLAGPGKPSAETDPVLVKDPIGMSYVIEYCYSAQVLWKTARNQFIDNVFYIIMIIVI